MLDGPRYHSWNLRHLVPEVVTKSGACVAVFGGLRCDGALAEGTAYCGRPPSAYNNAGERITPPDGMCFAVFVNDKGAIFDWDWIRANDFGVPLDWAERFTEPRWISLRQVTKSEIVDDGETKLAFSSAEDYVRLLDLAFGIKSLSALIRYPRLVAQVQADWHRQGQNGCRFAMMLNAARPTYGWQTEVLAQSTIAEAIERIAAITQTGVASLETRIVSVLLPWVTAENELVELLKRLGDVPDWKVSTNPLDQQVTRVEVRLRLDGGRVLSWVLGFGPFAFLPPTRRAPFTELVVPVKLKTPGQHRMDDDFTRAHLADVPVPALTDRSFADVVDSTKKHRLFVVGGVEDDRAKAKVTLAVPRAAWDGASSSNASSS